MKHGAIYAPFPCPFCAGKLALDYKGILERAKCLTCHKISNWPEIESILKVEKIMAELNSIDLSGIVPDYSEAYTGKILPEAWKSLKDESIIHFNKAVKCWNGYKTTGNDMLLNIMAEEIEASAVSLHPIIAILSDGDYVKLGQAAILLASLSSIFSL